MRIVSRRSGQAWPGAQYVGRPSSLGNPFSIGKDGTRSQVIEKYRRWLWEGIKLERESFEHAVPGGLINALAQLNEDSVLVCWCAPEPCHAEIIERAWQWARKEGVL